VTFRIRLHGMALTIGESINLSEEKADVGTAPSQQSPVPVFSFKITGTDLETTDRERAQKDEGSRKREERRWRREFRDKATATSKLIVK
jgi:hypothetical protein